MHSERDDLEALRDALRFIGPESADLARRIERMLTEYELVRQRYERSRRQLYDAERQNEKLVNTLQDAKQQIVDHGPSSSAGASWKGISRFPNPSSSPRSWPNSSSGASNSRLRPKTRSSWR